MSQSPDAPVVPRRWLKRFQRVATLGLASAALLFVSSRSTQDAIANGDTRSISIFHMHTKETTTVTFRRDGRYVGEALDRLNHALRDWRNDDVIKMDPRLFDIAWEVHRELGSSSAFHVVSAYRSPGTNAMLRRRSRGVAKHSQHTEGKAMDFFLPDASSTQIRAVGMKLQRGGVGYYPTANTPFVHLDVGSVRSWPRMPREQLSRLFPSGNTVHIASDGRPMDGYEIAKAQILAQGGSVGGFGSTDFDEGAIMQGSRKSLWASLFGWNEEDEATPSRGRAARGRSTSQQVLAYAPPSSGSESGDMYAMLSPPVRNVAPAVVPSASQAQALARGASTRGARTDATQVAALPPAAEAPATAPVQPVPATPRFVAAPFPVPRPDNLPAASSAPVQMASVQPGSTGTRLNWQQGPVGQQQNPVVSTPDVTSDTGNASLAAGRLVTVPLPPRRPDVAQAVQLALASAASGPVDVQASSGRDPAPKLVAINHPAPPERPRGTPVRAAALNPSTTVPATVFPTPSASTSTGLTAAANPDRQALNALFAAVATGTLPAPSAKVTTARARIANPLPGAAEIGAGSAASLGFSQRDPNDTRPDRFSGPAVRSLPTTYISR